MALSLNYVHSPDLEEVCISSFVANTLFRNFLRNANLCSQTKTAKMHEPVISTLQPTRVLRKSVRVKYNKRFRAVSGQYSKSVSD